MDDDRNMKMLLKSIAQTIREEERTPGQHLHLF